MVGMFEIKPVFVLPEGMHKMTFTINGLDPIAADIKVLGANSKQYLVVKLSADKHDSKPAANPAEVSTAQPFDERSRRAIACTRAREPSVVKLRISNAYPVIDNVPRLKVSLP